MDIPESKTHLSKLIEQPGVGEEIVISKAGKSLSPSSPQTTPRSGGFFAGQIWEAADCWEPDCGIK